ncbi:carbohydrate esterase family 8 protein [Hyaloscypha variabilis F]|uniref:pectinesterase n=1 Tax=Hyaloscypha variabilis (strain UAMH 11265 / GT02V1 / F) TaxID=1149755 RepID=A0A2J6S230_HYAVF|nr:carbohydrate esterase family 8 protein [Hyaloscypha variabilis F]
MHAISLLLLCIFALVAYTSPTPTQNHPSRTIQKRSARTSNPGGCLEVQGTDPSSTQYSTLSSAVAALGSDTTHQCIFMWPGTYNERVTVQYAGDLDIYGYSVNTGIQGDNEVTITTDETSTEAGDLDASSALHLYGNNYTVWNVNIENTYGAGSQAVAVTTTGNYIAMYACGIYGYQDTLYAKSGYQYFSRCYIEGADDFIFGDAAAWFGDCTIACNGGGSITANNRASTTDTAWYVFDSSTITAASGWTTTGANYLGRPWGVDARVIYQKCSISDVINSQGWTTLAADATPTFEEFENTGAGSDTSDRLYETVATASVTYSALWGGSSSWADLSF